MIYLRISDIFCKFASDFVLESVRASMSFCRYVAIDERRQYKVLIYSDL